MIKAPFNINGVELIEAEAAEFLGGDVQNVANPTHANTLAAISQRIGVDVRGGKGGRVVLASGDQVLVAQVVFPPTVPRETTEYTDAQLALGNFSFVLVTVG